MNDWSKDRYIFLDSVDNARDVAAKKFSPLLRKFETRSGPWFVFRVLIWWLVTLLVIFVVLAYRPLVDVRSVSSSFALREYLGRMAGAIPVACAETDNQMTLPKFDSGSGEMPGAALVLQLVGIDTVKEVDGKLDYSPCAWRSDWKSILAFVSLDVGAIQKFTILALIFALILLKRHCLGLRLDAAAFPENDPNVPSGKGGTSSSMELAEHPISHVYRHEITSDPLEPIYPVPTIRLDGPLAPNSDTKEYKGRVHSARSKIARHGRTGPFDLIIDVLDAGAASGRVGDADKRMREAVFDYKQDLTGSLWPVTYTLWLLPTIGFLGTIYGISESLVRAKGLFGSGGVDFGKQIQLVVDGLGVAFDTTSMALICSAILYICQLRTEAMTDSLASHAQASLSTVLIGRMRDRTGPCWPADVDTNPRDSRTPQSD